MSSQQINCKKCIHCRYSKKDGLTCEKKGNIVLDDIYNLECEHFICAISENTVPRLKHFGFILMSFGLILILSYPLTFDYFERYVPQVFPQWGTFIISSLIVAFTGIYSFFKGLKYYTTDY